MASATGLARSNNNCQPHIGHVALSRSSVALVCPAHQPSFYYLRGWRETPAFRAARVTRASHVSSSAAPAIPFPSSLHQATASKLLEYFSNIPLSDLMIEAARLRDQGHPGVVTFSPKIFIPLTRLCRDECGYCTFAQGPVPGRRAYMTLDEVLEIARIGAEQGCTEALFTLGDKPELRYKEAADELQSMGFSSTLDYVTAAAGLVLRETGLSPHVNAGVMTEADLHALRAVSVSQGLMLESLSSALLQPAAAHYNCPDKEPEARLAVLEAAGRARVPFTTGILIGIGETRLDRIEALLSIRDSHARHGHVQEVIIQNFKAKVGTKMATAAEPPLEDLLWTIASARLILGPRMNIQAPPNLTPDSDDVIKKKDGINSINNKSTNTHTALDNSASDRDNPAVHGWLQLLNAGINDWGGVSPVTRDFVNPERPWPHLTSLAAVTAQAGKILLPRLPIYPEYVQGGAQAAAQWMDGSAGIGSPLAAALRHADVYGLARGSSWFAGAADEAPVAAPASTLLRSGNSTRSRPSTSSFEESDDGRGRASPAPRQRSWRVALGTDGVLEGASSPPASPEIAGILKSVLSALGNSTTNPIELSEEEIVCLFSARGDDFRAVTAAADTLRHRVNGDTVTYVVNRNINYTNVCTFGCRFCAFSKGTEKTNGVGLGNPYLLSLEEVSARTAQAWELGATEVCMQGGIHPDFSGDTYLRLLEAAKIGAPDIHVHAFSPLEVAHGASTLGITPASFLASLRDAGLGSLPGTAAEILDDAVRAELCPDKLNSREWIDVLEAAHSVGLRTTSTIMFGHVDTITSWAKHLIKLRELQKRTGGISEFVPLPFVHMAAPNYRRGQARAGPTLRECILMHAVARLALHPYITNIQASWVKMGPEQAAGLLAAGCNDMGGTLMNESITRAAGAQHGQEIGPAEMEALIRAAGRVPVQRTTMYGSVPAERIAASRAAPLLASI